MDFYVSGLVGPHPSTLTVRYTFLLTGDVGFVRRLAFYSRRSGVLAGRETGGPTGMPFLTWRRNRR